MWGEGTKNKSKHLPMKSRSIISLHFLYKVVQGKQLKFLSRETNLSFCKFTATRYILLSVANLMIRKILWGGGFLVFSF